MIGGRAAFLGSTMLPLDLEVFESRRLGLLRGEDSDAPCMATMLPSSRAEGCRLGLLREDSAPPCGVTSMLLVDLEGRRATLPLTRRLGLR